MPLASPRSGTVRWMLDRGLFSLEDDLSIIIFLQVNDVGRILALLNADRRARQPARPSGRPHPAFPASDLENCFKRQSEPGLPPA